MICKRGDENCKMIGCDCYRIAPIEEIDKELQGAGINLDELEKRTGAVVRLCKQLCDKEAELVAARAENERLRAALANSELPCVYCSLPAEEFSRCPSGFPGCARADDAVGCPMLGADLAARARIKELERSEDILRQGLKNVAEHRKDMFSTVLRAIGGQAQQALDRALRAKEEPNDE